MIGIDMELPKSCKECDLNCTLYRTFNEEEYEIKRHPNCQLVDLGKEDMSWEEFVEKCVDIDCIEYYKDEKGTNILLHLWGIVDIRFMFDGYIMFLGKKETWGLKQKSIEKMSYYQMYHIIKSLVGDER